MINIRKFLDPRTLSKFQKVAIKRVKYRNKSATIWETNRGYYLTSITGGTKFYDTLTAENAIRRRFKLRPIRGV